MFHIRDMIPYLLVVKKKDVNWSEAGQGRNSLFWLKDNGRSLLSM